MSKEADMATMFHSRPNYMPVEKSSVKTNTSLWAVPIGRFLFSLIFILSGLNHFASGTISYANNQGIPMADILVPVSGLIAMIGGLSVLTGFHARVGAALILIFLVPVTFLMHNFWAVADPQMAQMQMANFMKNLSIMGGAILVAFYGAGPISIDNHHRKVGKR
jgi:putative oxidoreductase